MPYKLLPLLLILCLSSSNLYARSFRGEGSDLLMGTGARAIGMGSAVTAATNDIYSVYWNPAGLSEMTGNQLTISKQLDSKLAKVSLLSIAFQNKWLPVKGYKTTVALSWLPRLHVKAEGNYTSSDFQSIFLRYALPGLPSDFDGEIETKTRDTRISFSITPEHDARWALGINIGRIHCGTNFCGVFANDPGVYKVASTDATAITFGFGAKYKWNHKLTFGLNVKDVHTKLDVETIVTDSTGTTVKKFTTGFPVAVSFGASYHYQPDLLLTSDYEVIRGNYGKSFANFQVFRAGLEKSRDAFRYRLGFILPVKLESGSTGNLIDDLPAPFMMTAGLGWKNKNMAVDFALYPHPLMSYERGTLVPSTELSVTLNF